MTTHYTESDIKLLSDLVHIRQRPGMYIGDTTNPKHLFVEALDNAADECMNGYASKVVVRYDTNHNMITVIDDGRGIPTGMTTDLNGNEKPVLEVLTRYAKSGGKFTNDSYTKSSGLHGVGLSAITALTSYLEIVSVRDNTWSSIQYEQGNNSHSGTYLSDIDKTMYINDENETIRTTRSLLTENHGTVIKFIPDENIFDTLEIPRDFLIEKCRIASTEYNIELYINDALVDTKATYADLVNRYVDDECYCSNLIEVTSSKGEVFKVYYEYVPDTKYSLATFCNLINTKDGGTHYSVITKAFELAWNDLIEEVAVTHNIKLHPGDVRLGLYGVASVFLSNPQFTAQTKEKLKISESLLSELQELLVVELKKWINDNEKLSEALLDRFIQYRMSQNKLANQKDIMKLIKINDTKDTSRVRRKSVVRKLTECTQPDRKGTELFLVEGDSAGGCFIGSTRVVTDRGIIRIDELVEKVRSGIQYHAISYSIEENRYMYKPILGGALTIHDAELVEVHLDNDKVITCTPDHPFLVNSNKEYVHAIELTVGTELVGIVNNPKVALVKKLESTADVYDITVDEHHNFLLADGCFVHNTAARSRNKVTQAVLPLRGKIKNVTYSDIKSALQSQEVRDIINAIGAGVGEDTDPSKSRYERIMLNADADPDGGQIAALLLSVLINITPALVKAGMVYLVQPPLYGYRIKGKTYFTNNMEEIPLELRESKKYTRYKGLGEMNDNDYKYACMTPETRNIIQVSYPEDVDKFNAILGTSSGRRDILADLGLLVNKER